MKINEAFQQDSPLLLMKRRNIVVAMVLLMRPKQWTKNLLVFAALIFSLQFLQTEQIMKAMLGFSVFCLISSCVYILNDFADRHTDRNHPEKRNRPIASGDINPYAALSFGLALLAVCIILSLSLNMMFGLVITLYFLMNVAYSLKLKHIVLFDIMIIAFGFVLRAIAGGLIIGVQLTPWFLVCTMLLSLFLAISKRRHEVYMLQDKPGAHRKVLEFYSIELLNQYIGMISSATIISYCLFTFTSGHSIQLMWTIPFVVYGIFRYLYLIYMKQEGGKPEDILLRDKPILITVLLYSVVTAAILYYFG